MIQDLHSHTYYSFCGKDTPEAIVEAAIAGGIDTFGITDHSYGVGFGRKDAFKLPIDGIPNEYDERCIRRYYDHIRLVREKYADSIRILQGIEIYTSPAHPKRVLPDHADVSFFDYCLLEAIDEEGSLAADPFAFAKRCGCPAVGIAHTDLFAHMARTGNDPMAYLRRMAEQNIFWEINVNYDSIHEYREHTYVRRFFEEEAQQRLIRESGVRLSVGFDGHRVEDYLPERIKDACDRIRGMGIRLIFEE